MGIKWAQCFQEIKELQRFLALLEFRNIGGMIWFPFINIHVYEMVLQEIDEDGSGCVDYEEFKKLMLG